MIAESICGKIVPLTNLPVARSPMKLSYQFWFPICYVLTVCIFLSRKFVSSLTWSWGSIIKGQRRPRVTKMAFSIDTCRKHNINVITKRERTNSREDKLIDRNPTSASDTLYGFLRRRKTMQHVHNNITPA